jgi:hypothetical protein
VTTVPNDSVPCRIRAGEKLMRFYFIVSTLDRDMPFPVFYVRIVNRMGIATVTA